MPVEPTSDYRSIYAPRVPMIADPRLQGVNFEVVRNALGGHPRLNTASGQCCHGMQCLDQIGAVSVQTAAAQIEQLG
jgi:hypothetical protein